MRPSTEDEIEESRPPRLHMILTGLHPSLTSPISPGASGGSSGAQGVCVLKMCPPLTTKVGGVVTATRHGWDDHLSVSQRVPFR